ncbi:hypothetical protein MMEU_4102 [Mycobacterium marinum str. Europe]|nr:hypothetical protein MMEU_4102 [Mycobacterium marinum str. Europe]
MMGMPYLRAFLAFPVAESGSAATNRRVLRVGDPTSMPR